MQKGKSLSEIMYEVNNTNAYKKFQKREKVFQYFFIFAIVAYWADLFVLDFIAPTLLDLISKYKILIYC